MQLAAAKNFMRRRPAVHPPHIAQSDAKSRGVIAGRRKLRPVPTGPVPLRKRTKMKRDQTSRLTHDDCARDKGKEGRRRQTMTHPSEGAEMVDGSEIFREGNGEIREEKGSRAWEVALFSVFFPT